jgi:hypothetical protein
MNRARHLRGCRPQRHIATTAGVSEAFVSQIENERLRPPATSKPLRRLSLALGWIGDPVALLEEVGDGQDDA